jgi:type II secretory pathway pseudopilin PulG
MNADFTTVTVAVLGVAGTLSAPVLTQRIAARARQQEFELQREQRREEAAEAQRKDAFTERRALYAGLNTAARRYTQELRSYLRMIADGQVTEQGRADLAAARQAFRDVYSDAQMILPDRVMDGAAVVNANLGDAYAMIRRLEGADQSGAGKGGGESIESARHFCNVTLYDHVGTLRQLMREDLGVSSS